MIGLNDKLTDVGTQLYFYDGGGFAFRNLKIKDGNLIESKSNIPVNKWPMYYVLQKRFDGYRSIKPANVTVSYARDMILDPFNQLNENEKPKKGKEIVKDFVAARAEAVCNKLQSTKRPTTLYEKIIIMLGVVIILLAIGLTIGAL